MREVLTPVVVPTLLLLSLFISPGLAGDRQSKSYDDLRKMLLAMENVRLNEDKLISLFIEGDARIEDFVRLLDDRDEKVSLRAQKIIRYLGNPIGIRALYEWYGKQKSGYTVAGPIPLPLNDWDYNYIAVNLIDEPPMSWGDEGVQYIYALALDNSSRAKTVLDDLIKRASGLDRSTFIGRAIRQVRSSNPGKLLTGEKEIANLVLNNAFFVTPEDRKRTTARLLGLNGAKDKALVELYINRGALAEEWYHIILSKCDQGWIFFSVTQIAIS